MSDRDIGATGCREFDLPLLANVHMITVNHFCISLKCNFKHKQLTGNIILFLESNSHASKKKDNITLEKHISVSNVDANQTLITSDSVNIMLEDRSVCENAVLVEQCAGLTSSNEIHQDIDDQISHQTCSRSNEIAKSVTSTEICNITISEPGYECASLRAVCHGDMHDHRPRTIEERCKNLYASVMNTPAVNANMCLDTLEASTGLSVPVDSSHVKTNLCGEVSPGCTTSIHQEEASPSTMHELDADFVMVLDAKDLEVMRVHEVVDPHIDHVRCCSKLQQNQIQSESTKSEDLCFSVQEWCIRIWKVGVNNADDFPKCISIAYRTKKEGPSLKWTFDQDDHPCVFSHGHWINNRSFFPCQDNPASMATWCANFEVPPEYTVLMSGDATPIVSTELAHGPVCRYLYECNIKMPASTICLAIGQWDHVTLCQPPVLEKEASANDLSKRLKMECPYHTSACETMFCKERVLPCRLFAPKSMLDHANQELSSYIARYLEVAASVLGPHPFCRLDILLVPKCFATMAMACPSLILMSQSLLPGDQSMCIRLAHEICHSWFGLLIGPRDWTEEWLTEGFATYLEDIVHTRAALTPIDVQSHPSELRSLLRYKTLLSELTSTDTDLQILRPNQVDDSEARLSNESITYVKHGMNPEKTFMQVHYLKGYFLLRHLAQIVGNEKFLEFFREFVARFHGQLVSSKDVFHLVFEMFPELSDMGVSIGQLYTDWLDQPGLPHVLADFEGCMTNKLVQEVKSQVLYWKLFAMRSNKGKKAHKRLKDSQCCEDGPKLLPDQLVLLLEYLLEESTHFSAQVMKSLNQMFCLSKSNADVRHRWCELIIKHRCTLYYTDVEHFLIHDQAMGVYLFGELIISLDRKQQKLAEKCFNIIREHMEEGPYKTVHAMIYGS